MHCSCHFDSCLRKPRLGVKVFRVRGGAASRCDDEYLQLATVTQLTRQPEKFRMYFYENVCCFLFSTTVDVVFFL
ncbi:hypothetical protein J6590_037269 [Homalodisca vitripennis]|nr:hypothetical protein J6590_037269 [Homalodisca vitripennis]